MRLGAEHASQRDAAESASEVPEKIAPLHGSSVDKQKLVAVEDRTGGIGEAVLCREFREAIGFGTAGIASQSEAVQPGDLTVGLLREVLYAIGQMPGLPHHEGIIEQRE